jgi:hypothetical protein
MPADNKLELVVEVDVARGDALIKSLNTGLSSMEQPASKAGRGASTGIDSITVSMAKEDGAPEFRGEFGRLRHGGGGKSQCEDQPGHSPHYGPGFSPAREQNSEVRSQNSEFRIQKSEVRSQKSE